MSSFDRMLEEIIPSNHDDGVRVAIPAYRYLADKVLIVPGSQERFMNGVEDIYHLIQEDHVERYGEILIPAPRLIADTLDQENNNIISLFYEHDKLTKEKVRTLYVTEVTPTLSTYIVQALEKLSLPYSHKDDITHIGERIPCRVKPFYDAYQLKMFGDEIYDRK